MRSGTLAAQCLLRFLRGEVSLHNAAGNYRKSYEQQLVPVFRASSKIRRMLVLPRVLRSPLLFLLENSPVITQYLLSKTR